MGIMETKMYNTLLELPLFQGLGPNDITNIIEKIKINFSKHKPGEKFIKEGNVCDKLTFLLNGSICLTKQEPKGIFTWEEIINPPYLIEPQSLFGLKNTYIATYIALEDVHLMSLDKNYILSELNAYEVFRLNYYNMLCNRNQILYDKLWNFRIVDTMNKILEFFTFYTDKANGKKILHIKMEDFAMLIDDTRLNISKALNDLQDKGLVILRRKEIEIPDMAAILEYKNNSKK